MRRFFLLVMLAIVSCCCGGSLPSEPRLISITPTIDGIYDKTAALVRQHDDGSYSAFCTAVWVSRTQLLTAYHCAAVTLTEAEDADAEAFGTEHDMTGRIVSFRIWAETTEGDEVITLAHHAIVVHQDLAHDLALLSTVEELPHSVAVLAEHGPIAGERGHVLGMPMGVLYSYSPAWIGNIRWLPNVKDTEQRMIQVFSGANRGSSGGGLWSERGELWGIASFMATGTALVFYVHTEDVRDFLRSAQ